METPGVWINSVTFSDGNKVTFAKNDIVVLVGPNNAGKSAFLKEARYLVSDVNLASTVLTDLQIETSGTNSDLLQFVSSIAKKINKMDALSSYGGYGFQYREDHLDFYWNKRDKGLDKLTALFVLSLSTEERLSAANPPKSIKIASEAPAHPIHSLQIDDSVEEKFCAYFKQAFGMDLIVHRNAGDEVPLYIGEKPDLEKEEDRVSIGYVTKLEKLDLLHKQGDGMRSFVGVLLHAFNSRHSIKLIDEPEAFLHPPQGRLLGKMLATDHPQDGQLFVATHSQSFLNGLLDSGVSNLKVIRIQRDGSINSASVLDSEAIKSVWSDSLLRHSNILGGIFHSKVIICESDSDCRFYSALIDAQYEDEEAAAPDILFVHCGGKHRIPIVINALKKLNVPMRVVCDFDLLNAQRPLRPIFELLEGDWSQVNSDWELVKREIEQKRPEFLTEDVKPELTSIVNSVTERIFPKEKCSEIKGVLRKSSAWTEAKQVGKSYIPRGNATQAFERLQAKCEARGLFILEVGELECFSKTTPGHGPGWVSDVLAKDLKSDIELEQARSFIKRLVS